MTIKRHKPVTSKKQKPTPNPVVDELQRIHARYNDMFNEVLAVLKKHDCAPIETMRVANELSAYGFEQALGNVQGYIDKKIGEALDKDSEKTGADDAGSA